MLIELTKEEKKSLILVKTFPDIIQNSIFWHDPEELTYLRGLWFYYLAGYQMARAVNMTDILPELHNGFRFTGGAANILKRKSLTKDFEQEVIKSIKNYKGIKNEE